MSSTLPTSSPRLSRSRDAFPEDGFTLIEILVVVLIIGILTAISANTVFNVGPKNDKDQEVRTATVATLKVVQDKWEKSHHPLSSHTEIDPALFTDVVVKAADITVTVAPKLEPTKAGQIIGDYTITGWSENGTFTEEKPLKYDSSEGEWNSSVN